MYETMRYWETAHTLDGQSPASLDFARIWQAADKIVYSTTLQEPDTARTRVERDFDPAQVRKLKEAADRDLTVGSGTRALPDQVRLNLALAQEHKFGSGTVYLCYHPVKNPRYT
jgi:hypothetical protein